MTDHSQILDSEFTENPNLYFEDKSITNKVIAYSLRIINFIANAIVWVDFIVFYYYVFQAAKIIGHLPVPGDPDFYDLGMGA